MTQKFKIAKIFSIPMSKLAARAAILKFFKRLVEPKLDARHRGEMEIQNC